MNQGIAYREQKLQDVGKWPKGDKVEAPIWRLDPFPHSMKPPKVDSVIIQKWVVWILFIVQ